MPSPLRLGEVVRARRAARGESLRSLAARSGVSPSFLSQFENGHTEARVETLHRIARALDTTVHDLMGGGTGRGAVRVTRAGDSHPVQQSENPEDGLVRSLIGRDGGLEALEISGAPVRFGDFYEHDGTEMLYVLEGRIEVQVEGRRARLDVGETIVYPGSSPHRTRRLAGPVRFLLVKTVD